ncbi:MAG: hypothetical protein IJ848_00390 [Alphaproteobacteria bacterium]|nr:hypothetical protein [Alphaproteobacteria bacterium]
MLEKILLSLVVIFTADVNVSNAMVDTYKYNNTPISKTQLLGAIQSELYDWEQINKEDINISLDNIIKLQQNQIDALERARDKTFCNKLYKASLIAEDCAIKAWENPIIRNFVILPSAFYISDILIGSRLTSDIAIKIYSYSKEYLKKKFSDIKVTPTEKDNNTNISISDDWCEINKSDVIAAQQEYINQLENERTKSFFSRVWTGLKNILQLV